MVIFIENLYQEFPNLMIENCGGGALRSDHKTLRHFALQSTSDQELYENNPSILMGSLLQYPPEKAGVWSYPYPVMYEEAADFKLTDEYIARMADGRQTAFNMITAMMGVLKTTLEEKEAVYVRVTGVSAEWKSVLKNNERQEDK